MHILHRRRPSLSGVASYGAASTIETLTVLAPMTATVAVIFLLLLPPQGVQFQFQLGATHARLPQLRLLQQDSGNVFSPSGVAGQGSGTGSTVISIHRVQFCRGCHTAAAGGSSPRVGGCQLLLLHLLVLVLLGLDHLAVDLPLDAQLPQPEQPLVHGLLLVLLLSVHALQLLLLLLLNPLGTHHLLCPLELLELHALPVLQQ
mmetsp:Transcript_11820/g.34702  ORF Transcript_11820/g.34702 Transcript_11820/m.34702 type:complete len:203 (-) Transcript_11820:367-975(-)